MKLREVHPACSEFAEAVAEAHREKLQLTAVVHRQDGRRQGQVEAVPVGLG